MNKILWKIPALILTCSILVGGMWAGAYKLGITPVTQAQAAEDRKDIAANTLARRMDRWSQFEFIRINSKLTVMQRREYCILSKILTMPGTGCA
ncbi:MAG: hypothetical protein ACUZ8H_06785 [Candidatus Anammoxibacter sp.]